MRMLRVTFVFISVAVLYCQCSPPAGYTLNEVTGHAYKIMYEAQNWTNANDTCVHNGAKLAVPKTKDEFTFIQKLVRGIQYADIIGSEFKLLVWLGINNLEDYKVWKNVDGENIKDTGFHTLMDEEEPWPGEREPHCLGMDAVNPGLRSYWCHRAQAFVCEIKI